MRCMAKPPVLPTQRSMTAPVPAPHDDSAAAATEPLVRNELLPPSSPPAALLPTPPVTIDANAKADATEDEAAAATDAPASDSNGKKDRKKEASRSRLASRIRVPLPDGLELLLVWKARGPSFLPVCHPAFRLSASLRLRIRARQHAFPSRVILCTRLPVPRARARAACVSVS